MGYIKLNKNSFFHNLDYYSKLCGSKDKIAIGLKDNAYGHGLYEISSLCKEYGIKNVFVRDMEEANIIENFEFETVIVLYDIPQTPRDNISIAVNRLEDIAKIPQNSRIELKIDTGMNRNGIYSSQIQEAISLIKKQNLTVNGVFTHFCCADEDNDITIIQEKKFQEAIKEVKKYIDYNFRTHCANSAGAHKVDMGKYDLARIGIGIYGYLEDMKEDEYLKPVLSLHAKKIATKHLQKDDHVGYGSCAFIATKPMTVSNYNIGYGDGFFRFNENFNACISNGKKILGRVSMDSFSVEGDDDEICVFDDASHLANELKTIRYTIFTMLNANIKKVIY
jgi:alanine racemase